MSNRIADFSRSLRELARIQVNDWDFRGFMNTDLKDLEIGESLRRLGNLKVMEWDFRNALPRCHADRHHHEPPREILHQLTADLHTFLQVALVHLIREPDKAEINPCQLAPDLLRFDLLVTPGDVKELIGRGGATGAALRSLLKARAEKAGVRALLQIRSHDEALAAGT